MQVVLDFLRDVGLWIAQLLGITVKSTDAMYIGAGVIVLAVTLFIIIIVSIVKGAKKSKAKKRAKLQAKKEAEQAVVNDQPQAEQVSEQSIEEQPVEPIEQAEQEQPIEAVEPIEQVEQEQPIEAVEPVQQVGEATDKKAPVEQNVAPKKKATATKKAQPKKEAEKKETKKLSGKWIVEVKSAGEYDARLCASNGEVMLTSEIYASEEGARNGIASILRGIENGKFVIYQDKNNNYYYKLKTTTNRLLCVGEIYKSKEQCLKAVETVKRIASTSVIAKELVEGSKYIEYTPAPLELKAIKGKWRVEQDEDGTYSAKLYASNGQLMLSTEKVALVKSAKSAIEAVKKNAEAGNFIIDKDKFGRFYYKLRNVQKSVICIGEAYDKLDSCVKAIESVRRFALNSVIVGEEK